MTRSKTPEGESREIPLTERLFQLLAANRCDKGIVFAYEGEQVRIIKRSWKTALKNAGIRHVRFHDLRHTFNTRLMEAGVLQEIRMALMGHSSGSKVHATYTHIELPAKREAIRKLEAWVNQQQQATQTRSMTDASTETERTETGSSPSQADSRKPWKKKTPVEVVLEQADKLKAEIAEMEEESRPNGANSRSSKRPRSCSKGCSP